MIKHLISFISQDVSGREIELKDSTGLKSFGKEFGYEDSDIDSVLGYYLTFSRVRSSIMHSCFIDRYTDGYDISTMVAGVPFKISNKIFKKDNGSKYSSEIFNDGVLDINSYVVMPGFSNVLGVSGNKFITGGNFNSLKDIDGVFHDGVMYNVDDVAYTNGGTVIYLVEPLKSDLDYFDISYRSNIKALLQSVHANRQAYAASKIADMPASQRGPLLSKVHTSDIYSEASKHFFIQEDYYKSDRLSSASVALLKEFTI